MPLNRSPLMVRRTFATPRPVLFALYALACAAGGPFATADVDVKPASGGTTLEAPGPDQAPASAPVSASAAAAVTTPATAGAPASATASAVPDANAPAATSTPPALSVPSTGSLPPDASAATDTSVVRADALPDTSPEGGHSVPPPASAAALTASPDAQHEPPPSFGPPPHQTPGVPPDEELEAAGAVVGKVLIDNQNIFNLEDPKDNKSLFRLANRLHHKTRPGVIRKVLLFKSGDRYQRRLLDESERILRAQSYFYDAWIRPVSYHDGRVDVRVTTRDVWTLNPGFNYSRSGGTNSVGFQIEDISVLGTGIDVKVYHSVNIDRTATGIQYIDQHAFGSWNAVALNFANQSDGYLREFSIQNPFYALDTRWAAGTYGIDDLQTDSLWDRGQIIDQFQDAHRGAQLYLGWSAGLQDNGWVRRWTTGVTYDEHVFGPTPAWTGPIVIPEDRRFLYPWVQFDLLEDDFSRLWNHDQIARTEDFYLGRALSARVGYADAALGSSQSALLFQSSASAGLRGAGTSTLRFFWDFAGRVTDGVLANAVMDGSIRYYLEQSRNWLFFTTFVGTKGWNLDLDNQILLGGDNGLRGYPLRYQDGTARALLTLEQRYFTDWYPFRLFRVGGAIFFDTGRVWGSPPLAAPNYGLLSDAGFGLRLGNARSGLGAVVHVDLAFPFNGDSSIKRVQFLVQTERSF